MFEKVNPSHPDKVADRIAGAIVDLTYEIKDDPKVAVEVLIGHGSCYLIIESDINFNYFTKEIRAIIDRITDIYCSVEIICVQQDVHLAENQDGLTRCGDNGIFKGVPITDEEWRLNIIAHDLYKKIPHDGKYILDNDKLIICQSHTNSN